MADALSQAGALTDILAQPSEDKIFPFEKLPVEIQLMVLEALLTFQEPLEVYYMAIGSFHIRDPILSPADQYSKDPYHAYLRNPVQTLLAVSPKMFDEAPAMFFGSNCFNFYNVNVLGAFVLAIPPDHRALVKNIHFHWRGQGAEKAFNLLLGCTGLERMSILLDEHTLDGIWSLPDIIQGRRVLYHPQGLPELLKLRPMKEVKIQFGGIYKDPEGLKVTTGLDFANGEFLYHDQTVRSCFIRSNHAYGGAYRPESVF